MPAELGHRPRVFYVSYDGAQEPLGRSQVLPYLVRLAREFEITLISFEKSPPSDAFTQELARAGISWLPLRYHRRPPVLSTVLDVLAGRSALVRATRVSRPAIVHVRSYVPALIALLARSRTGGKLLFDIRGFWADERVEGGLWRPGGILYRIAKRCERRFFAAADAVVTLTQASVLPIRSWLGDRKVPIEVIPTCVEIERFEGRPQRPGGAHAVWCGSLGTWYRFDLAPLVAEALSLPLTVFTRQVEQARSALADSRSAVRCVAPEHVSQELFAGDLGLCLYRSAYSRIASAPTRFAEHLAAGMPVVVTRGIGDLEQLVESHRVGVVLHGEDSVAIATAAREMAELRADPGLTERCQRLARDQFDINLGAARYAMLYRKLSREPASRTRPR